MDTISDTAILRKLYDHKESHPGSPMITLMKLCEAISVPPSDKKRVAEVIDQLRSLEQKGWVECKFLEDAASGTVEMTAEGSQVGQELEQPQPPSTVQGTADSSEKRHSKQESTESSLKHEDNQEPAESPERHYDMEVIAPEPCPAWEDLLQQDEQCANLVQRRESLDEIIGCFTQTSSRCHSVVLYGEPMVGKTQMLDLLSEALSDEYVPLILTCQGLGLSVSSLDAFAFDLADQLTNKFGRWAKRHKNVPNLDKPDWKDFRDGKGRRALHSQWSCLREKAGRRQPIIMLDEIERLLDYQDELNPQILTFLDDFMCRPENGYFVIAGSERIRSLQSNALFRRLVSRGRIIRVRYYNKETVSTVFTTIQKHLVFDQDLLQCLTALCDGHPRLLPAAYQAAKSLGKQRLEKDDIDPIMTKLIDRTNLFMHELLRRLTFDEHVVVWLISQSLPGRIDSLECSLDELDELADKLLTALGVHYDLHVGIDYLEEREWIEWKDREHKSFHFKLGVFPLWLRRRHISPIPDMVRN